MAWPLLLNNPGDNRAVLKENIIAIRDEEAVSEESHAIIRISAWGLLGPEAPGYQAVRNDKTSINLIKLTWPQLISNAKMIITGQIELIFPGVLF